MAPELPRIIVTDSDLARLQRLLDQVGDTIDEDRLDQLEAELSRAEVVPADRVPPNVVTMNSRVVFEDVATGDRREAQLVYPHEVRGADGRVSILAPIGTALLGLSTGDTIDWPVPGGHTRKLRVVSVTYQPESTAKPAPAAVP